MPPVDTKTRILDAAEQLFARNGFSATSLRTVIAAAGVNLASVHYHFGSKEGLIEAVFARRVGPLNERRLALLDQERARRRGRPVPVERIVFTLVYPVVELATGDQATSTRLMALFGRIHSEPDEGVRLLLFKQFDVVRTRYVEELARALPQLDRRELAIRFQFSVGAMAAAFTDPARVSYFTQGLVAPEDKEQVAAYLVTFLSAGLSARPTRTAGSQKEKRAARSAGRN